MREHTRIFLANNMIEWFLLREEESKERATAVGAQMEMPTYILRFLPRNVEQKACVWQVF